MQLSRSMSLGALLAATVTVVPVVLSAQATMAMPAQKAGQAPLSPRDSLKVSVAGSDISVNYGRPSKRERVIFGGMKDMQWGMVWRMGANEATHFTTSKPLAFGSKMVPAGTYTLFVLLDQGGKWELIVNKQTKQWGTAYDAKQDLVRIPMKVSALPSVVETMEIMVTPAGKGGELAVHWDKTKAVAAFTVK
ncbi:MAG: DUF2911 domain-containing protein [Gemmatimonadaceae bacterium]|nr:DUF2911 domain-containing protein [Gemmatimonadaceae bacterium]